MRQLDADHVQVTRANILEGMRRQCRAPERLRRLRQRRHGSTVQHDVAPGVATDKLDVNGGNSQAVQAE